jgi:hypothetical protein
VTFVKGPSDRSSRSGRRLRRVGKVLGIVALVFVVLLIVSASVNLVLTKQEKSRFHPYGHRMSVDSPRTSPAPGMFSFKLRRPDAGLEPFARAGDAA